MSICQCMNLRKSVKLKLSQVNPDKFHLLFWDKEVYKTWLASPSEAVGPGQDRTSLSSRSLLLNHRCPFPQGTVKSEEVEGVSGHRCWLERPFLGLGDWKTMFKRQGRNHKVKTHSPQTRGKAWTCPTAGKGKLIESLRFPGKLVGIWQSVGVRSQQFLPVVLGPESEATG